MPPGSNTLVAIRSKFNRARKHVAELEGALAAFHATVPYKVEVKRDPATRRLIYYVAGVEPVPAEVTHITSDVLGNLVATLDHLAHGLFKKHTPSGDDHNVQFPISRKARTAADHAKACRNKVQGIEPMTVVPALLAIEAYQGGKGQRLWELSELNNLSKHRELIAVGSRLQSVDLGAHVGAMMEKELGIPLPELPFFVRPADPLYPLDVGKELFIDAPEAEQNDKMKFCFDVALHEPVISPVAPMIETVGRFVADVDEVVNRFGAYL
jgi:hypothetical protein